MTNARGTIDPNQIYQTWAFTVGPDHHNPSVTHATKGGTGKTLCGRSMYGYLESDLTRYGVSCRTCKRAITRLEMLANAVDMIGEGMDV